MSEPTNDVRELWYSMYEARELKPSVVAVSYVLSAAGELRLEPGPCCETLCTTGDGKRAMPPSAGITGRRLELRRFPRIKSCSDSIVRRPILCSTLGGTNNPNGFCGFSSSGLGGFGGRSMPAFFSSCMHTFSASITLLSG
jgi:hypothetical protein